MNLILLEPGELVAPGQARLTGRKAEHVRAVLRAQVGDALSVGELGGLLGQGIVRALGAEAVELEVALTEPPPPRSPLELVLALPRPKILRKVLQAVACLGVSRLVLLGSYRVEKSYFASPVLAPEAVREELLLGLEQGRDTRLPEVLLRRFFKPFIEDELEALFPGGERLLAHPKAPALPAREPGPGRAVLAVGPEGGWTPYEAGELEARGFRPFTLGPRILRVDVAVPYLFGRLEGRYLPG